MEKLTLERPINFTRGDVTETCSFSSNFVSSSLTLRERASNSSLSLGHFQTSTQQQGMRFELFEFQLDTLKLTYNLSVHNPQISIIHHDHIAIFTWLSTHIIVHRSKRSNFSKRVFHLKIKIFVLMKNLTEQLVLIAQSILKLDNLKKNSRKIDHQLH
jgi:hypothetical protein